jgi:hypothetical protein
MARAAALNDNVGYDQGERDTFDRALREAGDDPSAIKIRCETDCSAGVIAITKAIGRKLGIPALSGIWATYTGNMRQAYRSAGYQVLTDRRYLVSPANLMAGDILLNDMHHVATNLDDGDLVSGSGTVPAAGTLGKTPLFRGVVVTDGDTLNVRTWAGAEYPKVSFSPLPPGAEVDVCGTVRAASGNPWYYVRVNRGGRWLYGFAAAAYIQKQ